jgi:hypothetical protein
MFEAGYDHVCSASHVWGHSVSTFSGCTVFFWGGERLRIERLRRKESRSAVNWLSRSSGTPAHPLRLGPLPRRTRVIYLSNSFTVLYRTRVPAVEIDTQ